MAESDATSPPGAVESSAKITYSIPETVPGGLNVPLSRGQKIIRKLANLDWCLKDVRIYKRDEGRMSIPLNRLGEQNMLSFLDIIKNNPALANTIQDFIFQDLRNGIITYDTHVDYREELDRYLHNSGKAAPGEITFIELFAGIGGFRLGLEPLGGKCVFSCDLNDAARKQYEAYFLDRPEKNVVQLDAADIPPHDILTAGFPCQSFSNLGKRLGFEDPKTGGCFFELVRIIRKSRPKCIFLENVMGLIFGENGAWFKLVIKELEASGYVLYWNTYDSLGQVPQKRERVYFVGFREDLKHEFTWPISKGTHNLRDVLQTPEEVEPFLETPKKGDPDLMLTKRQWDCLKNSTSFKESRSRIVNFEHPARCIVSSYRNNWKHQSQLVFQHEARPRFFSPREVARIMGFPESFPVDNPCIYRLLGNAVVPPVIEMIGKAIFETLRNATPLEPHDKLESRPRRETPDAFITEYIRKSRLWSGRC